MSENQETEIEKKINTFAEKYKLKFVIPLVIFGLTAVESFPAAIAFAFFMGVAYLIGFAVFGSIWSADKLFPKTLVDNTRSNLLAAVGLVVFLTLSWVIGTWF